MTTRVEKAAIRRHWAPLKLKFMSNGTVLAKKGECWGILYTNHQRLKHLQYLQEQKKS